MKAMEHKMNELKRRLLCTVIAALLAFNSAAVSIKAALYSEPTPVGITVSVDSRSADQMTILVATSNPNIDRLEVNNVRIGSKPAAPVILPALPEQMPITPEVPVIPEVTEPVPEAPVIPEATEPTPEVPIIPEVTEPVPEVPIIPEVTEPVPEAPVIPEVTEPTPEVPVIPEITEPVPEVPVIPEAPVVTIEPVLFTLTQDGTYNIRGYDSDGNVVETIKYRVNGLRSGKLQYTHQKVDFQDYALLTVTSFFGATMEIACGQNENIIALNDTTAIMQADKNLYFSRTFKIVRNGSYSFTAKDELGADIEGASLSFTEREIGSVTVNYKPDLAKGGYNLSLESTAADAAGFVVRYTPAGDGIKDGVGFFDKLFGFSSEKSVEAPATEKIVYGDTPSVDNNIENNDEIKDITPEKPIIPEEPKPVEPVIPEKPKPVEPVIPEEPKPVEPVIPEKPKPIEPAISEEIKPVEPAIPAEPKPVEPVIPEEVKPIEPAISEEIKPVIPEEPKPVEPAIPEEPKPVEPAIPEEPKPVEPIIPEEPKPVEPAIPEEPKPVEPVVPEEVAPTPPIEEEKRPPAMVAPEFEQLTVVTAEVFVPVSLDGCYSIDVVDKDNKILCTTAIITEPTLLITRDGNNSEDGIKMAVSTAVQCGKDEKNPIRVYHISREMNETGLFREVKTEAAATVSMEKKGNFILWTAAFEISEESSFKTGYYDIVLLNAQGQPARSKRIFIGNRGQGIAPVQALPKGPQMRGLAQPAAVPLITEIVTESDLIALRNSVNDGNSYSGQTIYVKNDIEMTAPWDTSIGTDSCPFSGTFVGGTVGLQSMKTISNLKGTASLFGMVTGGAIKNIALTQCEIIGNSDTLAVLASRVSNAEILNCEIEKGFFQTGFPVTGGGLVGVLENSTLAGCTVFCDVNGGGTTGGIAGLSQNSLISDCAYVGNISVVGSGNLGGIAGELSGGSVMTCVSAGSIYAPEQTAEIRAVGGIAGATSGNITGCQTSISITAEKQNIYLGGIAGVQSAGEISNCLATSALRSNGFYPGESCAVGGILGTSTGASGVKNAIASGTMGIFKTAGQGSKYYIGGLVGFEGKGLKVSHCIFNDEMAATGVWSGTSEQDTDTVTSFGTASLINKGVSAMAEVGINGGFSVYSGKYPVPTALGVSANSAVSEISYMLAVPMVTDFGGGSAADIGANVTMASTMDNKSLTWSRGGSAAAPGAADTYSRLPTNGSSLSKLDATATINAPSGMTQQVPVGGVLLISNQCDMVKKGNGTRENPYQIGTNDDLFGYSNLMTPELASQPAARAMLRAVTPPTGIATPEGLSKVGTTGDYELTADISITTQAAFNLLVKTGSAVSGVSDKRYAIIAPGGDQAFDGTFDGKGHSITLGTTGAPLALNINGFFGYVTGTVKGINFKIYGKYEIPKSTIHDQNYGCIAYNLVSDGKIESCKVSGVITGATKEDKTGLYGIVASIPGSSLPYVSTKSYVSVKNCSVGTDSADSLELNAGISNLLNGKLNEASGQVMGYKIENCTVGENVSILNGGAGIVNENQGIITGCTVKSKDVAGAGIANRNMGKIDGCIIDSMAKIGKSGICDTNEGNSGYDIYSPVGGYAGPFEINNCIVKGTVGEAGIARVNGVVVSGAGKENVATTFIQNCIVTGSVGTSGIVEENNRYIKGCAFTGTLEYAEASNPYTNERINIGTGSGIASVNTKTTKAEGTIENCFSGGTVRKAGIVGENSGVINNCYSVSTISGYKDGINQPSSFVRGDNGNDKGFASPGYNYFRRADKAGLVCENLGKVSNCYFAGKFDNTDGSVISGRASLIAVNKTAAYATNVFSDRDLAGDISTVVNGGVSDNSINLSSAALALKDFDDAGTLWTATTTHYPKLTIPSITAGPATAADTLIGTEQTRITAVNTGARGNRVLPTLTLAGGVYEIGSFADLGVLRDFVNSGHSTTGLSFKLTADIKMAGQWIPIGTVNAPFCGTFDGNGKKITELTIENSGAAEYSAFGGLFGATGLEAKINNVILEDVTMNCPNGDYMGALVGYAANTAIKNCSVKFKAGTSMTGYSRFGGVAGIINRTTITGAKVYGNISGKEANTADGGYQFSEIGGVVGTAFNTCVISNSGFNGNIDISVTSKAKVFKKGSWIGGIIGSGQKTKIDNSYTVGNISVKDNSTEITNIGGYLGETNLLAVGGIGGILTDGAAVDMCFMRGDVSVTSASQISVAQANPDKAEIQSIYGGNAGGLVGYDGKTAGGNGGSVYNLTIKKSFAVGNVKGIYNVGGVVGYISNGSYFSNCYSKGSASGVSEIGGLAGQADCTVQKCYSTVTVNGTTNKGAIVGFLRGEYGVGVGAGSKIQYCYADMQINSGTTLFAGNQPLHKTINGKALVTEKFLSSSGTNRPEEFDSRWTTTEWEFSTTNYPQINGMTEAAHKFKQVSYYSTYILVRFAAVQEGDKWSYDKYTAVTRPFVIAGQALDPKDGVVKPLDWHSEKTSAKGTKHYMLTMGTPTNTTSGKTPYAQFDIPPYEPAETKYTVTMKPTAGGKFFFRLPFDYWQVTLDGAQVTFETYQEVVKSPFDKLKDDKGKYTIQGDGTKDKPFLIASEYALMRFAQYVENGSSGNDVHYKLVRGMPNTVTATGSTIVADLGGGSVFDLSKPEIRGYAYDNDGNVALISPEEMAAQGVVWEPTAWVPIGSKGVSFSGNLDGNSKDLLNPQKIINLTVGNLSNAGFIGAADSGSVSDMVIENIKVGAPVVQASSGENVGALIGVAYNNINISNVQMVGYTGNYVHGMKNVGGLIGIMRSGNITNSGTNLPVSAVSTAVGGAIGATSGTGLTINKSYATGDVRGAGKVGGFIGEVTNEKIDISESFATGDVTSLGDFAGGFIGNVYTATPGSIKNNFATGIVVSDGDYSGGLIGSIANNMRNDTKPLVVEGCFASGQIDAKGSYAGGLIGTVSNVYKRAILSQTHVKNSYAGGSVQGTTYVGGLVGSAEVTQNNCTYIAGTTTYNPSSVVTIDNCYASGMAQGKGDKDGNLFTGTFLGGIKYNLLTDWAIDNTGTKVEFYPTNKGTPNINYKVNITGSAISQQTTGDSVIVGSTPNTDITVVDIATAPAPAAPKIELVIKKNVVDEMVAGNGLTTGVWSFSGTVDRYFPQLTAFSGFSGTANVYFKLKADADAADSTCSTSMANIVKMASMISTAPVWLPKGLNTQGYIYANKLSIPEGSSSYTFNLKDAINTKIVNWSSSNSGIIEVDGAIARLISGAVLTDVRLSFAPSENSYGIMRSYLFTINRTKNRWTDVGVFEQKPALSGSNYTINSVTQKDWLTAFFGTSANETLYLNAYNRAATIGTVDARAIDNFLSDSVAKLCDSNANGTDFSKLSTYLAGYAALGLPGGTTPVTVDLATAKAKITAALPAAVVRAQLVWVAKQAFYTGAPYNEETDFAGKTITIDETVDIDLSARRWYPMGGGFVGSLDTTENSQPQIVKTPGQTAENINVPFQGKITAGAGKTVRILNLTCDEYDVQPYAGFFGKLGNNGGISNINFVNPKIYGTYNGAEALVNAKKFNSATTDLTDTVSKTASSAGVIAAYSSGAIENCRVVQMADMAGTIEGSEFIADSVLLNDSKSLALPGIIYGGGIAGENSGIITNSQFVANINGYGQSIGGIAGKNSGTISGCAATGLINNTVANVTHAALTKVALGGIAAINQAGTISGSTFGGSIGNTVTQSTVKLGGSFTNSGGTAYVGGIAGVTGDKPAGNFLARMFSALFAAGTKGINQSTVKDATVMSICNGRAATLHLGGVCGSLSGSGNAIDNSSSSAILNDGTNMATSYMGGVCGSFESGNISASYSAGQITSSNTTNTTSDQMAAYAAYIGGVVGICKGTITNSYGMADISRLNTSSATTGTVYIGGAAGQIAAGSITKSFAGGNISSYQNQGLVNMGGMAGEIKVQHGLTVCYSINNIVRYDKAKTNMGGLAGLGGTLPIDRCWTAATVEDRANLGTVNSDPVIGTFLSGSGAVTNTFYDRQLARGGSTNFEPLGNTATPKTTAQLCDGVGLDTANDWTVTKGRYPQIKAFAELQNDAHVSQVFTSPRSAAAAYNANLITTVPPANFGVVPEDYAARNVKINSITNMFKPVSLTAQLNMAQISNTDTKPIAQIDKSAVTEINGMDFEGRDRRTYAGVPENLEQAYGAFKITFPLSIDKNGAVEETYTYTRNVNMYSLFREVPAIPGTPGTPGTPAIPFKAGNGSGLMKSPFVINETADLDNMLRDITDTVMLQTANIDMANHSIKTSGAAGTAWIAIPDFTGTYFGNGYYIGNFKSTAGGLFGNVTGGKLQNIAMANANVSNAANAENTGILCNSMTGGSISDSYAYGNVSGGTNMGGIAGKLTNVAVLRSFTTGKLTADNTAAVKQLGGIAGTMAGGSVKQSYSTMVVKASSVNDSAGGLCGAANSMSIDNSYYAGTVVPVAGSAKSGAIVGSANNVTATSVYFDQMSTGVVEPAGTGTVTATPQTPSELSAVNPGGENDGAVWHNEAKLYPQLKLIKLGEDSAGANRLMSKVTVKPVYKYSVYGQRDTVTNNTGETALVNRETSAISALPVYAYNKLTPWMITAFTRATVAATLNGSSLSAVLKNNDGNNANGGHASITTGTENHVLRANNKNPGAFELLAYLEKVPTEGINGSALDGTAKTDNKTTIQRTFSMVSTVEVGVHVVFDVTGVTAPADVIDQMTAATLKFFTDKQGSYMYQLNAFAKPWATPAVGTASMVNQPISSYFYVDADLPKGYKYDVTAVTKTALDGVGTDLPMEKSTLTSGWVNQSPINNKIVDITFTIRVIEETDPWGLRRVWRSFGGGQ